MIAFSARRLKVVLVKASCFVLSISHTTTYCIVVLCPSRHTVPANHRIKKNGDQSEEGLRKLCVDPHVVDVCVRVLLVCLALHALPCFHDPRRQRRRRHPSPDSRRLHRHNDYRHERHAILEPISGNESRVCSRHVFRTSVSQIRINRQTRRRASSADSDSVQQRSLYVHRFASQISSRSIRVRDLLWITKPGVIHFAAKDGESNGRHVLLHDASCIVIHRPTTRTIYSAIRRLSHRQRQTVVSEASEAATTRTIRQ